MGGFDGIMHGSACSSFGADFDYSGNLFKYIQFVYRTVGFTADTLVDLHIIPCPNYIKIDVDGIEHFIIEGLANTLRNSNVKEVLIEVNDSFKEQATCICKRMVDAGFVLREKRHGSMFDGDGEFSQTFNQIWKRVI